MAVNVERGARKHLLKHPVATTLPHCPIVTQPATINLHCLTPSDSSVDTVSSEVGVGLWVLSSSWKTALQKQPFSRGRGSQTKRGLNQGLPAEGQTFKAPSQGLYTGPVSMATSPRRLWSCRRLLSKTHHTQLCSWLSGKWFPSCSLERLKSCFIWTRTKTKTMMDAGGSSQRLHWECSAVLCVFQGQRWRCPV